MTVFVSYSSRDKDAVKSLTQDLQDADEQVWMDQRLAGGDAWWRAILEQIRRCDVFIFALSQNSIQSKPCQAELHYAQALGLSTLPVQVGPVDSMQLNPLATVQTVDYRSPTPSTGMRLIAALHRTRAQRQALPSPLPEEPPVPFEYLIRLYTTVSNPDYLTPRDQAALVAQLQVGLGEDGQHEAAHKDIVMLLTKLHDREDATHRTRTDVEAVLAFINAESHPQPSTATKTTTVESPITDTAKTASETQAPSAHVRTAPGPANVDGPTQMRRGHQPFLELENGEASHKPLVEPTPPTSGRMMTTVLPASPVHRVGAFVIDAMPPLLTIGIGVLIGLNTRQHLCNWHNASGVCEYWSRPLTTFGLAAEWIGVLLAVAYVIWNWGYLQRKKGASIGKRLTKFPAASKTHRSTD